MTLSIPCDDCGKRFPSAEAIPLNALGLVIFLDFDAEGQEGAFKIVRNGRAHPAHSTGIRKDGTILCTKCMAAEAVRVTSREDF